MNADGIIIDNLYSYCADDPIGQIDHSGTDWNSFWEGVGSFFTNLKDGYVKTVQIKAQTKMREVSDVKRAVNHLRTTVQDYWENRIVPTIRKVLEGIHTVYNKIKDGWHKTMDAMQERQRIDIVMDFNAGVNITHTYTEFKDKYDIFGKWIHTALEVTGVTNIVKDGLKSLFTSPKPFKIWPIVDLEWETIVYILKDAEPMSLEKSY